jgi:hypothetical protein
MAEVHGLKISGRERQVLRGAHGTVHPGNSSSGEEQGLALLVNLIALSMFTLVAFYIALRATTEVRISDNHESLIRARFAARAGLSHARELLRGLEFDDLLRGPDGSVSSAPAYAAYARTFPYRNPLAWSSAHSIDMNNPAAGVAGLADDGIVNTGRCESTDGTALIPMTGIALGPAEATPGTTARYLVKVSDNNADESEMARDGANNPFYDGDGTVIVRSMGVARTLTESAGATVRRNSVAVFEARFRRRRTFDLEAALAVQGDEVLPSASDLFRGASFLIQGGAARAGIAAIDVDPGNSTAAAQQILSGVSGSQRHCIQGAGLIPSVTDVTAGVQADGDKSMLLSPSDLRQFTHSAVPRFADVFEDGNREWTAGAAPDLGRYDPLLPWNHPVQRPTVTCVHGDLRVDGNMEGGGLLVVTGKFTIAGRFVYSGLVLVIGAGELDAGGFDGGIAGSLFLARLEPIGGEVGWGTPRLTIGGNGRMLYDREAVRTGIRLIPPSQVGFREVTRAMDP